MKWSAAEENTPDREGKPEYSPDPMKAFVEYAMFKTNPKYRNVVQCHYGGRYDITLAARVLYALPNIQLTMIARGQKIMRLLIKKCRGKRTTLTEYHDSYNIITLKLAKLIDTFDLREPDDDNTKLENKLLFPYLFNQTRNYNREFDQLPSIGHYDLRSKKAEEYREAVALYHKQCAELRKSGKTYNLATMLDEYCTHDVKILALALLKYRTMVLEITGLDIIRYAFNVHREKMEGM